MYIFLRKNVFSYINIFWYTLLKIKNQFFKFLKMKFHFKNMKIRPFLENSKNISLFQKSDNFHFFSKSEMFSLFSKNSRIFSLLEWDFIPRNLERAK